MLTFYKEETSSVMGNGTVIGDKKQDEEQRDDENLKKTKQLELLNRTKNADGLIFFAGTDKARV
jgi:hypothetical protein